MSRYGRAFGEPPWFSIPRSEDHRGNSTGPLERTYGCIGGCQRKYQSRRIVMKRYSVEQAKKEFSFVEARAQQSFLSTTVPQPKGVSESRLWETCQSGTWLIACLKTYHKMSFHQIQHLLNIHNFVLCKTPNDNWTLAVALANTVVDGVFVPFTGCCRCLMRFLGLDPSKSGRCISRRRRKKDWE